MMWQPNSAQPVAYPPAYTQGYAAPQTDDESSAWIMACFAFGAAAGYGAALAVGGEEPTEKAKTIAAAGAYAATKNETVKSAGGAAATVYSKAVDLEQEYEVLPKAKSAIDTVVNVADNLNKNYGLTDQIDAKLQLSERAESLTEKLNAQKDKLTSKVDELKDKASS